MAEIRSTTCCGLKEYTGLYNTPTETLKEMARLLRAGRTRVGILMFSDAEMNRRGIELATEIAKKPNWGKVIASEKAINPNTRRNIIVWTWAINKRAFLAWHTRQQTKQRKQQELLAKQTPIATF